MYKIVALIGEAGCGKDTILKEILKENNNFNEIISCTTRPPREGEKDKINYFFLSKDEFKNKIQKNEMIEYTNFNNWFYGTAYDSLKKEKINIGVFNPSGIISLQKKSDIKLTIFKIECSDKIRLIRQLNREKNPNVKEIIRRFSADEKDFFKINNIDNLIRLNNEKKNDIKNNAKYIINFLDKNNQ